MMQQKVMLKWFKWTGYVALTLIIVVLGVGPGNSRLYAEPAGAVATPLEPTGAVAMRLDQTTRAVPVNGTDIVQIEADVGTEMDPNGLGAYEFDFMYDPDFLEVQSVSDADELKGPNNRTVGELPGPDGGGIIDNDNGETAFGAYSYQEKTPQDPGPTGNDIALADVTLKAMKAGVSTLNLENGLMTDTQANPWPDGAGNTLNVSGGTVWNIIDAFTHFTDFDGDGKADPAIWLPDKNKLRYQQSASGYAPQFFDLAPVSATANGIPMAGDYDGDGKADPTIWDSDSTKIKYLSSDSGYAPVTKWLTPADGVPMVGDFDGDGKADRAIWDQVNGRIKFIPSAGGGAQFYRLTPTNGIPLVGDYDGDNKDDPALWIPNKNRLKYLPSASGFWPPVFHRLPPPEGIPIAGDFDGDGKADPAVWIANKGRLKFMSSADSYNPQFRRLWPSNGIPQVGNYDGDNKDDPAVWIPDNVNRLKYLSSADSDKPKIIGLHPSTGIPVN